MEVGRAEGALVLGVGTVHTGLGAAPATSHLQGPCPRI